MLWLHYDVFLKLIARIRTHGQWCGIHKRYLMTDVWIPLGYNYFVLFLLTWYSKYYSLQTSSFQHSNILLRFRQRREERVATHWVISTCNYPLQSTNDDTFDLPETRDSFHTTSEQLLCPIILAVYPEYFEAHEISFSYSFIRMPRYHEFIHTYLHTSGYWILHPHRNIN